MLSIDVIIPSPSPRLWNRVLIERLTAAGHDVAVLGEPDRHPWPWTMAVAVAVERRIFRRHGRGLMQTIEDLPMEGPKRPAALRIDLAGGAAGTETETPTLRLLFDGSPADWTIMTALARGRLPEVEAVLDGKAVARAAPMVDKRESTALGAEDVLARAITLAVSAVRAVAEQPGQPAGTAVPLPASPSARSFATAYLTRALPRLGREALRRTRFRHAHWRVGYRLHAGPGVAETGRLGDGWRVLPDAGDHFYADPFPFAWQGRRFIFVEDYPHATGKAVISVSEIDGAGGASPPRPVLEEPHHLSYPFVFERDGAIWMLPEGSASGRLTLYRCLEFPDRWQPAHVLIEDREISDATLVEKDGTLYLLATERDGYGSTSDTLVVFHADRLAGPWMPHPMNPIIIDRRAARPGGAVVDLGERLVLPVQDGTEGYGGGLGLSTIIELDRTTVRLAPPQPIDAGGDWPYPKIHTLNRTGQLEVIDGIAAVRKGRQRPVKSAS
ncbi:MAG: glucosamine inositolphosphorylceramide transferase family protein [Pararhizobium sp.]